LIGLGTWSCSVPKSMHHWNRTLTVKTPWVVPVWQKNNESKNPIQCKKYIIFMWKRMNKFQYSLWFSSWCYRNSKHKSSHSCWRKMWSSSGHDSSSSQPAVVSFYHSHISQICSRQHSVDGSCWPASSKDNGNYHSKTPVSPNRLLKNSKWGYP